MHLFRRLALAALLLCLALPLAANGTGNPNKTPVFKTPGLHVYGAGLPQHPGRIAAWADLSGNKQLSALLIHGDAVTVLDWAPAAFEFKAAAELQLRHSAPIHWVAPVDLDHDGIPDLLVGDAKGWAWYRQDRDKGGWRAAVATGLTAPPLPITTPAGPVLLGVDAKGTPQLFRLTDGAFSGVPVEPAPCALAPAGHSGAVDLNGDCLSDLFLHCADGTYEVWLFNATLGADPAVAFPYNKGPGGALPRRIGGIAFADLSLNGAVDVIVSACDFPKGTAPANGPAQAPPDGCGLWVLENRQMPACVGSTDPPCRDIHDLCTADPDFKLVPRGWATNELLEGDSRWVLEENFGPGAVGLGVTLGDINLDGYPDVVVAVDVGSRRRIVVLENVAGTGASGAFARSFRRMTAGTEALDALDDARWGAFYDLGGDGTWDIVVALSDGTSTFVFNNYYADALGLKTYILSGACDGRTCPGGWDPYGAPAHGGTAKFALSGLDGRKQVRTVSHNVGLSSPTNLKTSFALFGLGRINNWVEEMFVGLGAGSVGVFHGLIPNAQIMALPPPLRVKAGRYEAAGAWRIEAFVSPASYSRWVAVSLVTLMLILGGFILLLELNERREDDRERRQALHMINFDAL